MYACDFKTKATTPKWHSINDDAMLFRRCMLVGVLPRIELFTDTYFVSKMTSFFPLFSK